MCLARLFWARLTGRRLMSKPDEQRPYFDQARGSARRDGHPAEIGEEKSSVAGPMLPADIDRDVVALEPRARRVPNFAVLARGMADDLREERVMVPIVFHLAKVGRENPGGLIPSLTRQTSLTRVARPDVEDLVR